jgi:hypothetical protein
MSTPSPSEPRPPEKSPALPSKEPAPADVGLAGVANDKLPVTQPTNLTAPPASRSGPVGVEWSSYPELRESDLRRRPRRRLMLPLLLFVATCLSTFWVGAANWRPQLVETAADIQAKVAANWQQGLLYMGAVLAILLTHEMGHFLQTVRYGIPASYPLCIPVPFTPIGTMGAVISMDGMRANRKQIFDIGLAGPLAGLVVAVPILYLGVKNLNLGLPAVPGDMQLYNPVIVRWMIEWVHPQWADRAAWISVSQLNPFFMAGWVGMLITGYMILYLEQAAIWTPMLILVILLGIHHPPTADDSVELDDFRWILGVASMAIPVLCFPLQALKQ